MKRPHARTRLTFSAAARKTTRGSTSGSKASGASAGKKAGGTARSGKRSGDGGTTKRPRRASGSGTQLELIQGGGEPATEAPEPALALTEAAAEPDPKPAPAARKKTAGSGGGSGRRRSAQDMAARQRSISVSEFFTKNRHLLGFDNPSKALLTTIKEAVDNSLDACEEAGILPDIAIAIVQLADDRYRVIVEDNGPGIVKPQIPRIFGELLYGSKFHTLKQSRGQQGIGISAAGMYGQLTTGRPVVIVSRTAQNRPAHHFEIQIDTERNRPVVIKDEEVGWEVDHGTRIEIEIEAVYKRGRRSVDGYVELTALANPHARFVYRPPVGDPVRYDRVAFELPPEPKEIKPHPHGVELGILMKMLSQTKSRNVKGFLQADFSRVSGKVADEIAGTAVFIYGSCAHDERMAGSSLS